MEIEQELKDRINKLEEELREIKAILRALTPVKPQDQLAIQNMHAKSGKFGLNFKEGDV